MEADPKYLKRSRMEHEGSWGIDTEIRTFATICNTTIFVYCKHGMNDKNNDNYVWLPYPPLHEGKNESNSKCIFIMNIGNHYEPVLDVTEDIYSRTPYIYIKNFVPKKYHQYISKRMLEAALVNNETDSDIVRELERPEDVYVLKFKDFPHQVEGLEKLSEEIDPNVFNLLCEWEDLEDKFVAKKSKYDTPQ